MILKTYKNLKRGYKKGRDLRGYPKGTKASLNYKLRQLLIPNTYLPAYLQSNSGAMHYLSSDPLDDRVLEEILGRLKQLFFPKISPSVAKELNNGGLIMDVGAFNGGWGVELLMRYPGANGVFLEPSPKKSKSINNSLQKSGISSRARLLASGIAEKTGVAWLVRSDDGSWGDWLEYDKPLDSQSSIQVDTISLADALEGVTPVIVKSNSEGGEFELVKQLLAHGLYPKIMILMVHPEMGNMEELNSSLLQNGFTIKIVKDHPRRPVWHVTHK